MIRLTVEAQRELLDAVTEYRDATADVGMAKYLLKGKRAAGNPYLVGKVIATKSRKAKALRKLTCMIAIAEGRMAGR